MTEEDLAIAIGARRDDDGLGWISADDTYSRTLAEYVEVELFGLCGCGRGDKLTFALDALATCATDNLADREYPETALTKIVQARPEEAAHFILHILNALDLVEHGGSVGGSWVTSAGKALIKGRKILEEQTDDEP